MKKDCKTRGWYVSGIWYQMRKILIIMKLSLLIILLSLFSAGASVFSQNSKLNLDYKDVTVKEVLGAIEDQSEFRFAFSSEYLDLDRKVTARFQNESVAKILDNIFRETDIGYKINDRMIILYKNESEQFTTLQQKNIDGKVTDSSGVPLPGVTVVVKGTTTGTITDGDGTYSLINISTDAILVFSFVGMKTQEIPVAGKSTINVALEEDAIGIEEVVAIGYGSVKKSDLTGSISAIASEDFERQPLNRAENILQGRSAGVQVTNTSGAPGGNIKIRIRGINSINSSNEPLVVIDGFIGGDLNYVNPSDIASINVLKDASATTIYGSRASNGVILITTKRGEKGKSVINFDSYVGVKIPQKLDLLNGVEWAENVNRERLYYGLEPAFSSTEVEELRRTGGTDWQDEIFKNAITQNYNISFSGGKDQFNYFISGRYNNDKGIVINGKNELFSVRSNFDFDATKWLHTTLNLNVTRKQNHAGGSSSAIIGASTYGPGLPIYDEETGDYFVDSRHISSIFMSPLFLAKENNNDTESNIIEGFGKLDFKLNDELTLSITGNGHLESDHIFSTSRNEPGEPISEFLANAYSYSSVVVQNTAQLSFKKELNKHAIDAVLAAESYVNIYKGMSNSGKGFPTTSIGPYNMGLAETQMATSNFSKESLQSFLGRLNYKFLDKYLLTATFRVDGSSKFEGNNKYATFPALAFAWNASEEEFIKRLNTFSSLKIRASWGLTGEQGIGPYSTNQLMNLDASAILISSNIQPGIGPGRVPNPDLKWETSEQYDLGFDMGFLGGRINLSADFYQKFTHDLLLEVNTPIYSGVSSVLRNLGKVENRGFDVELNGVVVSKSDFKWETSFNISHNKNWVRDLGTDSGEPVEFFLSGNNYIIQKDQPLGQMYGLVYDGIWQVAEADQAAQFGKHPGYVKWGRDEEGAIIKDVIGNGTPKLIWGMNNNFEYKNLYLNVFIQAMHGYDLWNNERYYRLSAGADILAPTDPKGTDVWSPTNPDAFMPTYESPIESNSSFFVENASFIRLKNVTLGYTFDKIWNLPIKKLNIYASGTNLLTITDYTGYDPEATTSGNNDVNSGAVYGAYPNSTVITFGLKVDF